MFRLALVLGIPDPFTLADKMPASLFNAWRQYSEIEPFGSPRDNWNAANICAILANVHRPNDAAPYSIDDFMYRDEFTQAEREAKKRNAQTMQTIEYLKGLAKNGGFAKTSR